MSEELSLTLYDVLISAAKLQQVVPDAVLVGEAAAAYRAGHRDSFDHDHVLGDLADRYADVLEAVEATDGWVTSVRASRPPMTLLGSLGGIEAGLRQLRQTRPWRSKTSTSGRGHRFGSPPLPRRCESRPISWCNAIRPVTIWMSSLWRIGTAIPVRWKR